MIAGSDPNRAGAAPLPDSGAAPLPDSGAIVVVTVSSLETQKSLGGRKVQGKGAAGGGVAIEVEKVCRICHLSPGHGEEGKQRDELIQLGCGCKDDLGTAHRSCAEAWFKIKGDRFCEICGSNAKNITGEEDRSFMAEWHEGRMPTRSNNTNLPERVGCWRSQPFCNFLMACLIIAFILPWFFRVNML